MKSKFFLPQKNQILHSILILKFLFFTFVISSNAQNCSTSINQSSFLANSEAENVLRYFDADVFVWPNGHLIGGHGFWHGLSDFCDSDLVIRVSTDGGATDWPGPGTTIFDKNHPAFIPSSSTQVTYGVHSPSFLISADSSKLHMFFLVKSKGTEPECSPDTCAILSQTCFSFENRIFQSEISLTGAYNPQGWSTPVEITAAITGYNIMNNARAIRLSNGMIALAATVTEEINTFPTNFRSYLLYSSDEGATWDRTERSINT